MAVSPTPNAPMATSTPTTDGRAGRRRLPTWLADVLIAILLVACGFLPIGGPGVASPQPPDLRAVPLLLLAALILPARRRWPVVALVACVVIACGAGLAGLTTAVLAGPVAIAVFAVTLHRPRRIALPLVIGAAVVLPLASLVGVAPATFYPAAFLSARAVQLAAVVAAAAGLGSAARARRATIAAITERAQRAEQSRETEARRRVAEDRLAIARDLHDLVAHQIAVINLQAGVASRGIRDRPDEAEQALAAIREAARSVIAEIGDLLALLRATGGDASPVAPSAGLHRLDALIALFEQSGLQVERRIEPGVVDVADAPGVVAYQVIQEGLTNAHKHAARHAVRLTAAIRDDALVITMQNDAARDAAGPAHRIRPGNGLTGMRERVVAVGGAMRTEQDGGGFRLTVTLPVLDRGAVPASDPVRRPVTTP